MSHGDQHCLTWIDRTGTHHFLDYDTPGEVEETILHLVSVDQVLPERIVIYSRPGMSVEEFRARQHNKTADVVLCPHCTTPMAHVVNNRGEKPTHIYTCPDCPNVMFEYSDWLNIMGLMQYLYVSDEAVREVLKSMVWQSGGSVPGHGPLTYASPPIPEEPIEGEPVWVDILKDPAHPCTLNGQWYGDSVGFMVEVDGNNFHHDNINDALKDYVTRVAKYSKKQEVKNGGDVQNG